MSPRSWTDEEKRHGDLLSKYLYLTRRVDMKQIEKTIQYLIVSGMSERPSDPNVFHLISFSEGFDLSPLFVGGKRREEGIWFATREPASCVVSRVALDTAMILLHRASTSPMAGSGGRFRLRIEGEERGRMGKLAVATDIFIVARRCSLWRSGATGATPPSSARGSTVMRSAPTLKDIMWTSSSDGQIATWIKYKV
ncbi:hypothetical protein Cni_G13551 [Canna indica]|uniref:NAF domain-containing protein n=1 Tax=Canna indica TaxID=4628 RepID=A0AAQ3QBL7_9LILI|nr:hypothetical protein Cni_G13551 [Canna indica]